MNAAAPRRLASVTAALCLLAIVTGACPTGGAAPREKAGDEEPSPEIVETASGLRYQVLEPSGGEPAEVGDTVIVHYTGRLTDGRVFDSSEGRDPLTFRLGANEMIKGFDEGVRGMRVGERRRLVIPYELGYGEYGSPPRIPAKATLIFEVHLLHVR